MKKIQTKMKMKMKQTINIPICLEAGIRKKKNFFLNLNSYNRWHFQEKNQLKKLFKISIIKNVRELKPIEKCEITFKIFYPTKRLFDLDNVGSVLSKFTHDVLTEAEIIPDDNYQVVSKLIFEFGGIDAINPRAEVEIKEII